MNWQLNKLQYPLYNLGPGKRIGIWVQGCTLACDGCVNQMLWSKNKGRTLSVFDVFNFVDSIRENYDGITISGGEPFQQYEQLIAFVYLIKTRTNLNIQCYTGYEMAELKKMFKDRLFLKYIDYLVDGRYEKDLYSDNNMSGSTNQKMYEIKEGKPKEIKPEQTNKIWSLNVSEEGDIYLAGIPAKSDLQNLVKDLNKVGIKKSFK